MKDRAVKIKIEALRLVRQAGELVRAAALSVPLAVGYLAGVLVKVCILAWAALAEGFETGRRM